VHGLPLAPATELRWRSGGDGVKNGVELGIDLGGTPAEEDCGGNTAILVLVILDLPVRQR
jgi:hypothetical protein